MLVWPPWGRKIWEKKKWWNCQSLDISGLNYFQEEDWHCCSSLPWLPPTLDALHRMGWNVHLLSWSNLGEQDSWVYIYARKWSWPPSIFWTWLKSTVHIYQKSSSSSFFQNTYWEPLLSQSIFPKQHSSTIWERASSPQIMSIDQWLISGECMPTLESVIWLCSAYWCRCSWHD